MSNRKTANDVSADLRAHEAKCEERWKSNICRNSRNQTRNERVKQYFKTGYVWCLWIYGNAFNSFFNRGRNNIMKISDEGFDLIKHFEGCELEAYKCAAGVWTIGYGHTKDVQEGDVWNKEKADFMLWRELEDEYEVYVNDLVTVPINQCQFDALVSWVYNLGPANLKSSTMLKKLNAGKYEEVPNQIKRWNKATVDGERKVLAGLTRRREAEALMFEGKKWEHI
jgi:lysozyme